MGFECIERCELSVRGRLRRMNSIQEEGCLGRSSVVHR